MNQFLELQRLRNETGNPLGIRAAATDPPKKKCIFCKSNNHDISQCKDLFKSIEQGKIKHPTETQEPDTAITTMTPENYPQNYPPPC